MNCLKCLLFLVELKECKVVLERCDDQIDQPRRSKRIQEKQGKNEVIGERKESNSKKSSAQRCSARSKSLTSDRISSPLIGPKRRTMVGINSLDAPQMQSTKKVHRCASRSKSTSFERDTNLSSTKPAGRSSIGSPKSAHRGRSQSTSIDRNTGLSSNDSANNSLIANCPSVPAKSNLKHAHRARSKSVSFEPDMTESSNGQAGRLLVTNESIYLCTAQSFNRSVVLSRWQLLIVMISLHLMLNLCMRTASKIWLKATAQRSIELRS